LVDDDETEPEQVTLVVPQPAAAEIYYSACAAVDQHNRDRQDTLCIERKLVTHNWSQRVNLSILGIIIVDTWLAWDLMTFGHEDPERNNHKAEVQKDFYCNLAAELIDNNYDKVATAKEQGSKSPTSDSEYSKLFSKVDGAPRSAIGIHLTPTKRKRKNKDGHYLTRSLQGSCRICKDKTTYQCSSCLDNPDCNDAGWYCFP
jgi:hypothetical protein